MSHDDSTPKRSPLAAAAVVLALVLTAAWAQPARAWCDLRHKVVCEIAFQGLNQKAKREVARLIRTDHEFRTFAESCTWPDRPEQRARASEHFINAPRTFPRFTDARCPDGVHVAVHRDHRGSAGAPHLEERWGPSWRP